MRRKTNKEQPGEGREATSAIASRKKVAGSLDVMESGTEEHEECEEDDDSD